MIVVDEVEVKTCGVGDVREVRLTVVVLGMVGVLDVFVVCVCVCVCVVVVVVGVGVGDSESLSIQYDFQTTLLNTIITRILDIIF